MRPQVLCNLALGLLAASTACNAFPSTLNFPDPRDETLLPRADLTGDGGKTGGLLVTSQRAAVANISTCAGGQCNLNSDMAANGAASFATWTTSAAVFAAVGSVFIFIA